METLSETEHTIVQALGAVSKAHPDCRLYLLLDCAQIPGALGVFRRETHSIISLAVDRLDDSAAGAGPALIQISGQVREQALLELSVHHAVAETAVSWIFSTFDLPELGTMLRNRLLARLPGNMEVLLRYFDPRVLPELERTLTPVQRHGFFQPFPAWCYLDRRKIFRTIAHAPATSPSDNFSPPLELDAEQEQGLLTAAFPDEMLRLLRENHGELLGSLPESRHYSFVADQILRGRHLGLEKTDDLRTYCLLALTEGENFADTSPWKNRLTQVKTHGLPLADILIRDL